MSCEFSKKSTSNQHGENVEVSAKKLPRVNPLIQSNVDIFVNTQLDILNNIDCDQYPSLDECQRVEIKFSDGQFDPSKTDENQTILVIDYDGMELPSILRYRSRVKAFFKLDNTKQSGTMENPSITTTVAIKNVMRLIDQRPYAPAKAYEKLDDVVHKKDNIKRYVGGGGPVLRYLMENNPRAEFVVFRYDRLANFFSEQFCKGDFDGFRHTVKGFAHKIRGIIHDLGIEYIIFVPSESLRSLNADWKSACPGNADKQYLENTLKMLGDELYSVIFDSPGVLGVQAGPRSKALPRNSLDRNNLWKNRIKVGYFSELQSNLDMQGNLNQANSRKPTLGYEMHSVYDLMDVFVNFGYQDHGNQKVTPSNTPVMEYTEHSLSARPYGKHVINSWAPPVALSYIIYLKNRFYPDKPLTDELIAQLKQRLTPRGCNGWQPGGVCKLQDPLKFYFHEVYRLHYLIK